MYTCRVCGCHAYYTMTGGRRRCADCQRKRMRAYYRTPAYREMNRQRNQRLYGLTLAAFEAMRAAQHEQCAICDQPFTKPPHIDHDHATGRVRGLLCSWCNRALGLMLDDPARLQRAIDYLAQPR